MILETSHHDFWRRQFPHPVELVPLPYDKPRPPVPSYVRGTVELALDPSLSDGLHKLSSDLNVPSLAVLLAAFKTVLFRYSGRETLVVGAAAQAACVPEGPPAASPALWPIQTDWSAPADHSGQALACEIARCIADASAHAKYPIRLLQSWAGVQDSAFGARLFNTALCQANNSEGGDAAWPMLDPDLGDLLMQCDVAITVASAASAVMLRSNFDSDLFEATTMRRLLGQLGTILEGIIRDPSVPVLRLPILTASERHQLIVDWNARDADFTPATTLQGLFESQVERTPEAVALTCEGSSLTYCELNQRANQLAHALRKFGVGPEVIVGICMDRSLELIIGLLGILKAGGAYLPIDPAYPKERQSFMLDDAQAPVLLTQSKLAADLPVHQAQVLCLDGAELLNFQSQPTSNPSSGATAENLAYVIYTSGTTGRPKGALITHRNVVRLFTATEHWYGFNERDVWTLFHSCAFDFSVWEIWGALLYGGRLVVVPFMVSRSPEVFYELLAKERVTVLNQTPSAFQQLIQAEESVGQKELALRYVIFGGEALKMQSLRPWFERHGDQRPQLVNMYGITETTVHVTYRPVSKGDLNSGSLIGVRIPDLRIYIFDAHRQPVPVGVPGEMYVGGAGLARGYLNRPELTAERFIPDHLSGRLGARLYKTGDLCRWLPDGGIEYLGRTDAQVKIRGFRIEVGEIESVLRTHSGVREAVVMLREEEERQLVAYVVRAGELACTTAELRDYLKQKLPDYMVPPVWVALSALPLTANGKVDRKALQLLGAKAVAEPSTVYVAPDSEAEQKTAAIWQDVLGIAKVGRNDNFFDLGGDSLQLTRVHSQLRQAFNKDIPMVDLFRYSTVRALGQYLAGRSDSSEAERSQAPGEVRRDVVRRHGQLRRHLANELLKESSEDGPRN